MWLKTITTPPRLVNTAHLTGFHIMPHESGEKWGLIADPGGYVVGEYQTEWGATRAMIDLQNQMNNETELSIHNGMVDLMHELREAFL